MQLVQDAIKEALAAAFGTSPVALRTTLQLLSPSLSVNVMAMAKGPAPPRGRAVLRLSHPQVTAKGPVVVPVLSRFKSLLVPHEVMAREVQARPAAMTVQQNARRLGPWPTLTIRRRRRQVTRAGNV